MTFKFDKKSEFVLFSLFNNIPHSVGIGEVTVEEVVDVVGDDDVVDDISGVGDVRGVGEADEVDEADIEIAFTEHFFSPEIQGPQVELISSHLENMEQVLLICKQIGNPFLLDQRFSINGSRPCNGSWRISNAFIAFLSKLALRKACK